MTSYSRPKIIAHRGACGYLPEHTRQAKILAHLMGADFLEQDIVASGDDQLLVVHDIHLDRTTDVASRFAGRHRDDGRYYARDFSLAEIRTLSACERMAADGSRVYPHRYRGAPDGMFSVHTLAEEIELLNRLNKANGRRVGLYPEIKSPAWHREEGVDIAPLLADALRDFDLADDPDCVYVQCFDDAEVRRMKSELEFPWRLVQLIGDNSWGEADTDYDALRSLDGLASIATWADAIGPWLPQCYEVGTDDVVLPSGLAQAAHDEGLAIHPYTFRVDDLPPGFSDFNSLMQFFVGELCVDGLFTDFTDRARQWLATR